MNKDGHKNTHSVESFLSLNKDIIEFGMFLVGPLAHLLDEAAHLVTDDLGSILSIANESGKKTSGGIRLDVLL